MKKTIGITLGDPAGIGPEIIDKALSSPLLAHHCHYRVLGERSQFAPGNPSRESAQAAVDTLQLAVSELKKETLHAVVTGPVHKEQLQQVGFSYPGQTEFFAEAFQITDYAMVLTSPSLTVALATTHIPLSTVSRTLKKETIIHTGKLLYDFLKKRKRSSPKIAVAGLNPHAGEGGKFGSEEEKIIAPAIQELNNREDSFFGPFSPDTIFYKTVQGTYDGVLCMYHDQALIPLKLLHFDQGVNITLGLPIIRTSPDHGTAFDIAGKGTASPNSMISAIQLAEELITMPA